eukprot:11686527-Ditylum_brightwellii.AAC.1
MKNPDRETNQSHATVPQTLYLFGARIQKRLFKASELTRYYKMVGCHLTVSNTVYNTVIKSFIDQWVCLKDRKCQTQPVVPKIIRGLPIMQLVDVFGDFLHRKIGVRTIPLSYVTMETVLASRLASVRRENLPHGEEFDSIEEELVAQVLHAHPPYHEDNAS